MAWKSIIGGAAAGLLAVVYRLATEKGTDIANLVYPIIKSNPILIIAFVVAALLIGLFIAWLIKLEPMSSGGGVPQVEGVVLYALKMRWGAVIIVRYIAGILGSLFGMSFGPEGPSIQLGAAINQGISKKLCKDKIEESTMVTAGAAAGLTAAFSAPLTGIIFSLEEIHRSFSPTILLSATAASLTADFISKYFFGLQPILYFQSVKQLSLPMYSLLIPLGIFVGIFGVLTNRGMLLFQTLFNKIPRKFRTVVALLICLPCGLFLPEILGGGRNLINIVEDPRYTLSFVGIILVAKILFSCTGIGSGTPGGIFMPIISIGALSGSLFGLIATHFGMPSEYMSVFVICGIAGGLSSCVKAPVTSIILTIEMTGSFIHILPVAVCAFCATFISDLSKTTPIYEALLKRYIVKNGYTIPKTKRGELMEFPVEVGSRIANKLLKDIEWPKGSLIIGLRRGTEELIPKGDTKIMVGDYLLIVAPENKEQLIKKNLFSLCHK